MSSVVAILKLEDEHLVTHNFKHSVEIRKSDGLPSDLFASEVKL